MTNLSDKYKDSLPFESSNITTITSNYTASNNETIFVNTASGAYTITLPSNPVQGSKIKILDIQSNATTNNIRVLGNGNNIGGASAYLISVVDSSLDLLFINNTKGWLVENSYIPIDLPGKPSSASAVDIGTGRAYNDAAATITFVAPETGGIPDYYEVVSSPGGVSASGGFSPIIITGLNSNTSYSFAIRSKNAAGYSGFSTSSNTITTTSAPQAPTISTITPGFESASVAFSANSTGGSTITGYTVTASPGGATATGSSSPLKVSGLTGGTSYTFTVTATNAKGTSSSSASSSSSTPFTATGGTIVSSGGYRYHTFTGTSSISFTGTASNVESLIVAGGAGGGASYNGGGGGAGGLLYLNGLSLSTGTYSVTVGSGGTASGTTRVNGGNGSNSSLGVLGTAIGGGGGGAGGRPYGPNNGVSGGSGGGGGGNFDAQPASSGGSGTSGQGNAGSGGSNSGGLGGGGGGASAGGTISNGGNGSSTYSSWGLATSTGQNSGGTYYYAGGGSGGRDNGTGGTPGLGGGGTGGVPGSNGSSNTGGGAGGGATGGIYSGGAGGSGIVIVRYPI